MTDSYGRHIHYLRLSVTDRCNLRCRYCMPEEGVQALSHEAILSFEEIKRLVRVMARLGIDRVRLTGGEPLVRKNIVDLARDIKQTPGIRFLGLTTNGVLLPTLATPLCEAGVDGLNISIDTLDPARYAQITRKNVLDKVLKGLEAALALPFKRVRVNSVLAPDSLQNDWLSVVGLAKDYPVDVRLIEWMPMAGERETKGVCADDALAAIAHQYGQLCPVQRDEAGGPARYWQAPGFKGRIGVIHAMSHNFCADCNRLRLTATGDLKLCLFYDVGIPLKPLLRGGATDEALEEAVKAALLRKPRQHQGEVRSDENGGACSTIEHAAGMYRTGG